VQAEKNQTTMSETEKELDKLKELLDIGFIQEEEYNRRKAEIITLTEERRATIKGFSSDNAELVTTTATAIATTTTATTATVTATSASTVATISSSEPTPTNTTATTLPLAVVVKANEELAKKMRLERARKQQTKK
jgi:hypothetical protein